MIAPRPQKVLPRPAAPLAGPIALPLAVLLFAGAGTAQGGADTIVKRDGTSLRGVEITALLRAGVKYQRGGNEAELPAHQVAEVEWGNVPESFANAETAMARGDHATALQLFGDAAGAAERPVLKAEARFLQGRAAVAAAVTDKAVAATGAGHLRAWLTEFPDHWRVPEGMLLLGRALRLGGLYDDAATTLRELDERATREAWGPIWSARAKYERSLALMGHGKLLDARSEFQSAASAAQSAMGTAGGDKAELVDLKVAAAVGQGETLIHEKELQRAADYFRNMAGQSDPASMAAGKAGEGEALFLAAVEGKDLDQVRRAQIALAEASVLDVTGGETSAKANYYIAKCLLALGDRAGSSYQARAQGYFRIVTRSYPRSRWAALARQELER